MNFRNPYWTPLDKIQLLQRWVLLHAYCYYELDVNYTEDKIYDNNAHQLADLMAQYPEEAKISRYAEVFSDYEGNTGMQLIDALKRRLELLWAIQRDVYILEKAKNS